MIRIFVLAVFLLTSGWCYGQIVLSEVMFDPDGSEHSDEFIEIVNTSSSLSVDLRGWEIGDGSSKDAICDAGEGLVLRPGQYGLILDPDYFEESILYDYLIPEGALVLIIDDATFGSGGLSNSQAETIMLYDPDDMVVSQYRYSIGNSSGFSDEKIDMSGSDNSENWMDSAILNGTPGFRNSVSPVSSIPEITLTISPNPFSPDGDGIDDLTTITYGLPNQPSRVNLRIFDIHGRCIRSLLGAVSAGYNGTATWDGKDNYGRYTGLGIYIVYIESLCSFQGHTASAKATIVLAGSL
ncbi:lamin tail domain-containing protein [bacterium]